MHPKMGKTDGKTKNERMKGADFKTLKFMERDLLLNRRQHYFMFSKKGTCHMPVQSIIGCTRHSLLRNLFYLFPEIWQFLLPSFALRGMW